MSGGRKLLALLAMIAVGAGTNAGALSGPPGGGSAVVLRGVLSGYAPATRTQAGSITIAVSSGSPMLAGSVVTFAVTLATKVVVGSARTIRDGDAGTARVVFGEAAMP